MLLIFGIIALIAGIVGCVVFGREEGGGAKASLSIIVGVIVLILCIGASCVTVVKTGYTGIPVTFGRVEDYSMDAGLHFKGPFTDVVTMENRVQKNTAEYDCFSSDIQDVMCTYTVNYQISKTNAQSIYRTLGRDYADKVLQPNISEAVKTVIAKYTAESLISKRETMAKEIEEILRESLNQYNIEVASTSLENLEFKKEFTDAVEAKQIATQNKLKAATEQEQKTMEAEQEAERNKIKAAAEAEVKQIQAQADLEVKKLEADAVAYLGEKEAEANKALANSITPELIDYVKAQGWNGILPGTYVGVDPFEILKGITTNK